MRLKDFLDRFCILPVHFARKMKFYPNVIYRLIREGKIPSLPIALRIEEFTEGKVTCRDIYNECMDLKEKQNKRSQKHKQKNSPKAE